MLGLCEGQRSSGSCGSGCDSERPSCYHLSCHHPLPLCSLPSSVDDTTIESQQRRCAFGEWSAHSEGENWNGALSETQHCQKETHIQPAQAMHVPKQSTANMFAATHQLVVGSVCLMMKLKYLGLTTQCVSHFCLRRRRTLFHSGRTKRRICLPSARRPQAALRGAQ